MDTAALVVVEEPAAPDAPGKTPRDLIRAWAEKNARWLLIGFVVALLPYLLVCNGMAVLVVRGLLSGSCGGG